MSTFSLVGGVSGQPPPSAQPLPQAMKAVAPAVAAPGPKDAGDTRSSAGPTGGQADRTPTPGQLSTMVGAMQKKVASYSPELQFSIDQASGKSIVKLTDKSTDTLIWQFPSDQALQIAKELDQYQQGLVVNRSA